MEEKSISDTKTDSAAGEDNSSSEKEDDKNIEGRTEQPTPDCAGDEKVDDSEKVETESELADVKQVEKMEVKEEKDVVDVKEVKEEEEGEFKSEVKEKVVGKVEEEDSSEAKQPDSDSKPVSQTEEEAKEELSSQCCPSRENRRSEEKAGSDLASGSGTEESNEKAESEAKDEEAKESNGKGSREEEDSIKSDGGSDKENLNGDAPMDLSNAGTPDVIMLSDEEETEEQKILSLEQVTRMKKRVRHLQSELRNEEAKLVLLKKLRQSQLAPPIQEHPQMSNNSSNQQSKQNIARQPSGPPPLVRGGHQGRGSNLHIQQQQQGRLSTQGQMRNIQGPPPLVGTPRGGPNNANGHSSQGMRGAHMSQQGSSNHRSVQQQQQSAQHQQAATPPQPPVDTQTPAQRQAAAKLALRKQLEKTLLQIPPPKPPAPEMNFIPSLACPDFVLLLGLEEVVNHIIDLQLIARGQKSPDEKFICNPFTCVQCGTDYTPVWKREKPGSKNVICEHCVTWNQKRALKQEHTNRLKSAFVKALQQEQEIERMQAPTPSAPTPSATPPASMSSAPPQAMAAAAAASNVAAAAAMSMNPSFRASAEQVRQHHNFLQQAHQAQLRAGQPLAGLQGFGARSPFPYTLPYVKQADLQRQYLLDMIPRAGMPWKP